MVPKGAKGLELELGATPLPHVDAFEFRIAVEGSKIGSFRFGADLSLRAPIDLPERSAELIQLKLL